MLLFILLYIKDGSRSRQLNKYIYLYLHLNACLMSIGDVIVVIVWYLDWQLSMQSVPITTKVMSSNPAHGEVYSIPHYMIKFVSDLGQVGGFHRILLFPPLIKLTARHNWPPRHNWYSVDRGCKHHNSNHNPPPIYYNDILKCIC